MLIDNLQRIFPDASVSKADLFNTPLATAKTNCFECFLSLWFQIRASFYIKPPHKNNTSALLLNEFQLLTWKVLSLLLLTEPQNKFIKQNIVEFFFLHFKNVESESYNADWTQLISQSEEVVILFYFIFLKLIWNECSSYVTSLSTLFCQFYNL